MRRLKLLRGGAAPRIRYPPNAETVEMLEDMLARARRGELQCAVVAGVHIVNGEECTGTGFSLGKAFRRPVQMLGALEMARARVLRSTE